MLLILLIVLAVLALTGGYVAAPTYGAYAASPLGLILVIIVVLALLGKLHL